MHAAAGPLTCSRYRPCLMLPWAGTCTFVTLYASRGSPVTASCIASVRRPRSASERWCEAPTQSSPGPYNTFTNTAWARLERTFNRSVVAPDHHTAVKRRTSPIRLDRNRRQRPFMRQDAGDLDPVIDESKSHDEAALLPRKNLSDVEELGGACDAWDEVVAPFAESG